MTTRFDYKSAKSAGASDEEIANFLSERHSFDISAAKKAGAKPEEIATFLSEYKPAAKNEPLSAKGAATSYAGGVAGGAGGLPVDILNLAKPLENVVPGLSGGRNLANVLGLKGTEELSQQASEGLGGEEPQNAMERILRHSGQFGGQEALLGTALGGPVGAGAGLAHGSASGALYGGLKEAGMDDEWALGLTALATLSPIAAERLWPKLVEKFKSGKGLEEAIKEEPSLAKAFKGDEPPPPPGGGEMPDTGISPAESRLTAPSEYLKSDFELAEDIRNTLSPLEREGNKLSSSKTKTAESILEPISQELDKIHPQRINDPNLLGRMAERSVQQADNKVYAETQSLWSKAKEKASSTVALREELATDLEKLLAESPQTPKGTQVQVENFAERLLERIAPKGGFREISNKQLIEEIQQARKGYDYRYSGGVEGHRINQFINTVEAELMRSATDVERQALLNARNATAEWAQVFKDPSVLPFRRRGLSKPQDLYRRMSSPDTFNIISPILDQTSKGRVLSDLVKRNMVEKTLEPYLLRPQSANPLKLHRDLGKFQGILTPEQIQNIGNSIQKNTQRAAETLSNKPKTFSQMNLTEIPKKLDTIEGLRQLKKELSQVPRGLEQYETVAKTKGIDRLFGGQMDLPSNTERIEKLLNNRNDRFYLNETLGTENMKALETLANENRLKRVLEELNTAKGRAALTDPRMWKKIAHIGEKFLRGNVATAVFDTWDAIKKIKKNHPLSTPKSDVVIK